MNFFKSFSTGFIALLLVSSISFSTDFVFENDQFSFQALRTAGYTFSGGADIGECLSICSRIEEADTESWYNEWFSAALSLKQSAETFLTEGAIKSAEECFFRASGYFRTAEFYLRSNPDDSRALVTWQNSRDCFLAGAELSDRLIIPVKIPFEDTFLPAYLCLVDSSKTIRPMIIAHSGFDGTKEELYFSIGKSAINRGYNCLVFEGPGQGQVIREQGIPFRPNWESVVTPVVDYVFNLTTTDTSKVVLIGYSMGGYLAPRAVAYEHRIVACVANGATYSMYANAIRNNPENIDEILDNADASKEYDENIYAAMEENLFVKWFYTNGIWTFQVNTPSDLMRSMQEYTLENCVQNISCPMLILDSENDALVGNQAEILFDSLTCQKEYILFTEEEGADEHCQMGATQLSNERIFAWLEKILNQ